MFGKKKDLQDAFIIDSTGNKEYARLEVGTLCMADPDKYRAWELDYNQQVKDVKSGRLIQFVSTLNKKPLKIYKNRPQTEGQSAAALGINQFYEQLSQIHRTKTKEIMLRWLVIIALSLLLIIALIVLLNLK